MLLLILATGFVLLPSYLARRIDAALAGVTGCEARSRNVCFWGAIGVGRVELLSPGDSTPLLACDSVVILPRWGSLLSDTFVIQDIVVDQARLRWSATEERLAADSTHARRAAPWFVHRILVNRALIERREDSFACRVAAYGFSSACPGELRTDTRLAFLLEHLYDRSR